MFGSVKNDNKAYTYTLYAPGKGNDAVEVHGKLPQQFLVSVGSNWEGNAAGDSIKELIDNANGGIVSRAASTATTLGGSNVAFTALANRQWSGSMPLTFNLLAEFDAYENALEDVMRPVTLLQSLAMATTLGTPSVTLPNGATVSAGNIIGPPYWQDAVDSGQVGGKSTILLRIGTMFIFDDMIVESVNLTQDMRLAEPGLPIHVQAEIQVSTRGPITFEQYIGYMTGEAFREFFNKGDRIQAAREAGPGQRAGYSGLTPAPPTR
jgi:hypothetical protein